MKWIAADPEHRGGKPRVERHAVSPFAFFLLLESLAAGHDNPGEIVRAYPTLTE